MTDSVEIVLDAHAELGEGALWHAQTQRLYWVDILQGIVHVYDPATNTWTQVASMPLALSHYNASTVLFDRYIITVGGENPHNVAQPYVFAYDTVLDRWARLTDLPNPRRAGVAGLIGTKLIQSTGYNRSQGETATTYIADLANTFT